MMLSSPLQTFSSTMDDRSLRAYLQNHFEESLHSTVHFPSELRSINLDQIGSTIVEENNEHEIFPMFIPHQTDQQIRNLSSRPIKFHSSSISESGHPRNLPDSCSIHSNPPKDIQVLIRKGDHTGMNSLIRNVSLQQFRQMIGLQRSSGLTTINDRKHRYHQSLSSANSRIISAFKQQENKKLYQQQIYSRQYSSISRLWNFTVDFYRKFCLDETMNDGNLTAPITTCQEIRRTGVANTLHIAIEKCYEQLNYIRDSYAETESKIGIQMSQKPSFMLDLTNTNVSSLSNNPSRVDRLIAEYHYEYNRIIRLHERIQEDLSIQAIEATRQTLDEWFNTIHIVQNRRRQEIDNAYRSGEARLPDEKDILQLAEALRILCITTRKIRTVLWYWLYWSTNSTTNKIPIIARHQDELNQYDENLFSSINSELFNIPEFGEQGMILCKKKSILSNENNKENE